MNIFDFDNTIYEGDSTKDIIKYFIKKYPFKVLKCLLKANKLNKMYKKGQIEFKIVKETMLAFLFDIKNLDEHINKFVILNIKKIKPWYLKNRKESDTIISASYELWIRPFCNRIGIKNVIATKVDDYGKIIGANCKGVEKINRLRFEFGVVPVIKAFGDSVSDIPMLEYAKEGYVVKGNSIVPYQKGMKF